MVELNRGSEAECEWLNWIEAVQAKRLLAHRYRSREHLRKALAHDNASSVTAGLMAL